MRKLTTVSFCPFPFLFLVVLAAGTDTSHSLRIFLPANRAPSRVRLSATLLELNFLTADIPGCG